MKPCFRLRETRRASFRAAIQALTFTGLAAGTLFSLQPTTARANSEDFWLGGTGNFNDPTQWSLGRVPISPAPDNTGSDNADVFNNGTTNILPGDNLAFNDTNAGGTNGGVAGDGTYTQSGGSVAAGAAGGWFRLGTSGGTTGTYNLQGGTFNFGTNGGAQFNVGESFGSTGNVTVSGGTLTIGTMDRANIGQNGSTGNLTITGGSFINNSGGHIAIGDGNSGNNNGNVGTVGTFNLSGTGSFESQGELWIGEFDNAQGTVNMTGGSLTVHNWIAIARERANGTLNLSGGTITKDSANNVGSHVTLAGIGTNQTATVNQTGGNFIVSAGGNSIWLGETGKGVWTVSGGTLQAADGIIIAVQDAAATGTLTINPAAAGGTDPVVTTPTVTIGSGINQFDNTTVTNFASATLNMNGGTLATNGLVSTAAAGTRTLNLNGGTLRVTAPNDDYIGAGITSVVGTGGAKFDTNGNNATINVSLGGAGGADGGLTKLGGGMLTLTGANSYSGPTVVSAGALVVTNLVGVAGAPAGAVTVATAGTLAGTGTFNLAANAVTINGVLSPGAAPQAGNLGTLNITTTGTFTLASTATTRFDINTAVNKDLIMASGAKLVIQGGTLALNLPAGFDYTATYTIFSGLATETGAFSIVTGTNTTRVPTFTFTGGNYNLSFAAVPEPSTWAMGVFGLGLGAYWLRRRRVTA